MTGNERNASETYECDVLVAGSGCSGMSAAITARYREFADMRHFPDWEKVYAALGIRDAGGHLHLETDAPDAALRDAIMAPRN